MPIPADAADPEHLPYATACDRPLEGRIRDRPEDFRVEEIPAYEPGGEGDHLYVWFEKTELGTPEAVRRIARALDADPRQAGYAGLKDRRAVTRQWASFLFGDPAKLEGARIEGVTVLETARHRNKLRTGHLRGNRFDLLVRDAHPEDLDAVRAQLAAMAERGVPSYFGPQRFGRDGANLAQAAGWILEGGRPPRQRFRRKLLVSALQSAIFNELLAERVREGLLDGLVDGDLMQVTETGGLFVSEDPETDRARAARFEISATGPMFGAKMRWPERDARRREEAALARWGLPVERLATFRKAGAGTRRPCRVPIFEPSAEPTPEGLRLRFRLPSGAYATVVLRELMRRAVR
ncbi:MAG TPA: tRNA pseudouridine(13) synthase TruD [Sandaracinaceae bacterium LLY-WYZ-13_1]|nr:tRNA pseudouridine(13) synthase TruD [Sandaracinaceae bacterium LLY-WYZ-13_1]